MLRYAFIINPASGNGKNAARLKEQLAPYQNENIKIYYTDGEKDATVLSDSIAQAAAVNGDTVNIFACGGDGTVQETAIGLLGHDNARLGIIPVGSGNDFVRCFEHPEHFKDIAKQMLAGQQLEIASKEEEDEHLELAAGGQDEQAEPVAEMPAGAEPDVIAETPAEEEPESATETSADEQLTDIEQPEATQETVNHLMKIDVLEYTYEKDGETLRDYAVNGINIGFDGNTAILAHDLKELPLVQGSGSYVLAILVNLVRKKGTNLRVIADGEELHDGPLILCTAANGRFCGGGVESCPEALLDNGKIELLLIKDVTRRFFVKVFPAFKDGRLKEIPGVEDIIISKKVSEVTFTPNAGSMKFVADGEIRETGAITVRVIPKALTVIVP